MIYRPRLIARKVHSALATFPVVVLAGARQTGKSMLLKNDPVLKMRPYFSCDDPQTMLAITASGEEFLRSRQLISLDEAQRVPQLFLDLKRIVDVDRQRGRFLLSGSAQFLLLKNLGDTLAGRAGYIRMLPLSLFELLEINSTPLLHRFFTSGCDFSVFSERPVLQWDNRWLSRGSYPEPAWDCSMDVRLWFEAYEATYLERDIRDLSDRLDPLAYQRFLRIAASSNGSLLNQATIARDAGLNSVTCGRYMDLLEASGLLYRIYPYFDNIGQRYVKSPKILFTDTALAAHLAGVPQALEDDKHPKYGHCIESFVLQNLLVLVDTYQKSTMKLFHLRTASGFEIDAVLEADGMLVGIEVKSSRTIDTDCTVHLKRFMGINGACKAGIVAYRGDQVLPLGKGIWAVPLQTLLT